MVDTFLRLYLIPIILFVVLLPTALAADRLPPRLHDGMDRKEVVQSWGEPETRTIYETKREELWTYEDGEVQFRGGKVVGYRLLGSAAQQAAEVTKRAHIFQAELPDEKQVAVEDILSEIMREVPEEETKPERPSKLREKRKR